MKIQIMMLRWYENTLHLGLGHLTRPTEVVILLGEVLLRCPALVVEEDAPTSSLSQSLVRMQR